MPIIFSQFIYLVIIIIVLLRQPADALHPLRESCPQLRRLRLER